MDAEEWTELEIVHPIWVKPVILLVKAPHETIKPIMDGVKAAAMLLVQCGGGKKELTQYYVDNFTEAGFEVRTPPFFPRYAYLLR